MADDARGTTVVLHDQNDFDAEWAPSSHVGEQARRLRTDPAAMARVGDAIEREVERRWAPFDGAPDDPAHR